MEANLGKKEKESCMADTQSSLGLVWSSKLIKFSVCMFINHTTRHRPVPFRGWHHLQTHAEGRPDGLGHLQRNNKTQNAERELESEQKLLWGHGRTSAAAAAPSNL